MKWLRFFNSKPRDHSGFLEAITEIIQNQPRTFSLYNQAFTHPAEQLRNEEGDVFNYERLEFLGDALIGSITANYLFQNFPKAKEGQLTKMRSKLVGRKTLNRAGDRLQLSKWVNSELSEGQRGKHLSGNLFEALTGAIYADLGFNCCELFIQNNLLLPFADIESLTRKILSYKSLLLEYGQKNKKSVIFHTSEITNQKFQTRLFIEEKLCAEACASSKKKAEEEAARKVDFSLE